MWRLVLLCLSYSICLPSRPLTSETLPPWVSCFSDSGVEWKGPKTVRTPLVTSAVGQLRAYAVMEARAEGGGCLNTVKLFVATGKSQRFQQVYLEKGSALGGTANSLGPISWSPNGRWLLVAFGNWYYASDAGGVSVLLYDRRTRRVISPDMDRLVQATLKKKCSIRTGMPFRFDFSSRVHLQLADEVEEGDEEPMTHCFKGEEEWAFEPETRRIWGVSSAGKNAKSRSVRR